MTAGDGWPSSTSSLTVSRREGRSWCTRCLGRVGVRPGTGRSRPLRRHPLRLATWSFLLASRASTSARSRPEGLDYLVVGVLGDTVNRLAVSEPGATAPLLPAIRCGRALAGIKAEFGGSDWLCVADIEPLSGQDDLIKALWAFSRLYGLPARLHLVGATPDGAYLGALRDFVEDLGLVGAVQLVGPVSAEIAAAYFAAADVYVTASVADTEGTRRAVRARVPSSTSMAATRRPEWCSPWRSPPSSPPPSPPPHDTAFAAAARNRASRVRSCGRATRMKVAFVTPRYGPE